MSVDISTFGRRDDSLNPDFDSHDKIRGSAEAREHRRGSCASM